MENRTGAILTSCREGIEHRPLAKGEKISQEYIKGILSDAVSRVEQGSRLPSVRSLAEVFSTTIVTIQRAIDKLAAEGVVCTRPRSGVFVGAAKTVESGKAFTVPPSYKSGFVFASDSTAGYQGVFWNRVVAEFNAQNINMEAAFSPETDHAGRDKDCDVYERSAWSKYWPEDSELLDISKFVHGDLSLLKQHLAGSRKVILHYRPQYLFVNMDLLKKAGVALPQYNSFSTMVEYLDMAISTILSQGMPLPVSITHPVVLLGRYFNTVVGQMTSASGYSEGIRKIIKSICELLKLFKYPHELPSPREEFSRGECPFYFGYSVDLWEMAHHGAAFDMNALPFFAADDGLILQPILGAVCAHSRFPIECLRFLDYVSRPQMNGAYSSQGCLANDYSCEGIRFCTKSGKELKKLAMKSQPIFPQSELERYQAFNILEGEMFQYLAGYKTFNDAMEDSRHFADSYIKAVGEKVE